MGGVILVGLSCKPQTCNWAHFSVGMWIPRCRPGYRKACKGLSFALPLGERVHKNLFLPMEGFEGRAFVGGWGGRGKKCVELGGKVGDG
jgi:hypothetical protein